MIIFYCCSFLDHAIIKLTSGIKMIDQLRDTNRYGGCTEKIACQMGQLVRSNITSSRSIANHKIADWILEFAAITLSPNSISNFSKLFFLALDENDTSACYQEIPDCVCF